MDACFSFLLPFFRTAQGKPFCFITDCSFSKFSHHLTPLQIFSAIPVQGAHQGQCKTRQLARQVLPARLILLPQHFWSQVLLKKQARSGKGDVWAGLETPLQSLCQPAEDIADVPGTADKTHQDCIPRLQAGSFGDPSTNPQHHTMASGASQACGFHPLSRKASKFPKIPPAQSTGTLHGQHTMRCQTVDKLLQLILPQHLLRRRGV